MFIQQSAQVGKDFYFLKGASLPQVALAGQGTVATRAVLPTPVSVCSIFMCPNNGTAGIAWDF